MAPFLPYNGQEPCMKGRHAEFHGIFVIRTCDLSCIWGRLSVVMRAEAAGQVEDEMRKESLQTLK
jgi:hypothetical protein